MEQEEPFLKSFVCFCEKFLLRPLTIIQVKQSDICVQQQTINVSVPPLSAMNFIKDLGLNHNTEHVFE